MRRLVATALLAACAGLASGCAQTEQRESTTEPTERTAQPAEPAPTGEPGGSDGPVVPEGFRVFAGDGFRVALPCTPDLKTIPITLPSGTELEARSWGCASSEVAFAVSTTTFPRGLASDLDGVSVGIARQTGGTVVADEAVSYAGLPGRDVTVKVERGGQTAMSFSRALKRGRTLVQVQVVVVGDAAEPPSDYPKILGSLELT
ncbi:hypothetical protein J2X46_003602 [Nocardioides sp. BE266]|uniref:hypothetical protein n=1 Tax=Nocardioides sp. BE266 TaxID=2817725 RepID=UPI00285C5F54|nr:hypothetical protein [Nocardioides sp. BE266]MDR7254609.1 hypothetical protein [Nocardioides sp. BE266]